MRSPAVAHQRDHIATKRDSDTAAITKPGRSESAKWGLPGFPLHVDDLSKQELDDQTRLGDDPEATRFSGGRFIILAMRILRESDETEMVAVFLQGELSSERFGAAVRDALVAVGEPERLLANPDLDDEHANQVRNTVLAATRGYGEDRELFEYFPAEVQWVWAQLAPEDLARVRYIEYSYWNELSGGSRLAADAARRINADVRPFGVSNAGAWQAARALLSGERFPPLILAGPRYDDLVCLEGNVRLTAHALAGFPIEAECLVGTAPALKRWAQ